MQDRDAPFRERLRQMAERDQQRALRPVRHGPANRVERGGAQLIDFASNDYLGLSRHPALAVRASDYAQRFGTGAGASRLVTGTSPEHMAIEARIATLKGQEAALLFASGWQLNAAVIPALVAAEDTPPLLFADRLIHASLHHGIAAAGVRQIRFRHNDLDHLNALLREHGQRPGRRIIVTETVFSMDGDRADMPRLAAIARAHDALLYLDEAHATGVLGPGGEGLALTAPGDVSMGTFSKALGGFGAYIAGSRAMCDYLVNRCSGFVYSTALPPAVLGAIDAALDLLPTLGAERQRVADHAQWLRDRLHAADLDTGRSSTQIVPVMVGSEAEALALSAALETAGFLVTAIRPPTVPPGTSRLRIALSATHRHEDVERLAAAIVAAHPASRT